MTEEISFEVKKELLLNQLELINNLFKIFLKDNYFILYHYISIDLEKNEISIPLIIKTTNKKYNFLIIKSNEKNKNNPTYSYFFDITLGCLDGANIIKNEGNNINLFILLPSNINFNLYNKKVYEKIRIDRIIPLLNYELETDNNILILSKDCIITDIIPLFENKNYDIKKLDLFNYYKPNFFISLENKIDIFFKNPTYIIKNTSLIKINHITNDYHKSGGESIFIEKLKSIYDIF